MRNIPRTQLEDEPRELEHQIVPAVAIGTDPLDGETLTRRPAHDNVYVSCSQCSAELKNVGCRDGGNVGGKWGWSKFAE